MSSMHSSQAIENYKDESQLLGGNEKRNMDDPRLTQNIAVQTTEPNPVASPADDEASPSKKSRVGFAHRLNAKLMSPHLPINSSKHSVSNSGAAPKSADETRTSHHHHHHHQLYQYYGEKLLAQVGEWLERERAKVVARGSKPVRVRKPTQPFDQPESSQAGRQRADSVDSRSSQVSLYRLQSILDESLAHLGLSSVPRHPTKVFRSRRRTNSRSKLPRAASLDTKYMDGDAIVPECDAWLDNSKTLNFAGGSASTDDVVEKAAKAEREREAWLTFKNDIIRIAHTLRLKGWRCVGLDRGDTITVERLSGALTNAVYVVTPPSDLSEAEGKRLLVKILLRVYGPQVEHLIDRDNELKVLQRLARKKIGPRLLGTFRNGRFEEYFNAMTLKPLDLREPETSRKIAKRMRELHDGIELLPRERDNGPGVWRNWDQWHENVAKIITFLDKQLESTGPVTRRESVIHAWKANGYVCGVPWAQFRDAVAKYRAQLNIVYKYQEAIKERLVFAHNDTQYGNILRMRPDDEKSPLLKTAKKHKQLVVIDFEYAAANMPGLDFANHFTEWTYNYHDPVTSYACITDHYPTTDEQRRFIKAYVDHRPQYPMASSTPRLRPVESASSSIIDFMLDARAPSGGWGAAERDREEQSNQRVRELMEETRLWRAANSAQWVAWGIVQATVPGLGANNEPLPEDEARKAELEAGVDEFDYLSYAQDRALFFWGDVVQMGLVRPEELPAALRARIKMVER